MKKIIFTLIATLGLCGQADAAVKFKIRDGIDNQTLIDKMEQQTGLLLTAINDACQQNTDLNLSGLDISNTAIEALASCWENVHFSTEDDFIAESCLTRKRSNGSTKSYQFRNIGLTMFPLDDAYDSGSRRELCIDFTPKGNAVCRFSAGAKSSNRPTTTKISALWRTCSATTRSSSPVR